MHLMVAWMCLKAFCFGSDFILKVVDFPLHNWKCSLLPSTLRGDNNRICVGMGSDSQQTAMTDCVTINRKCLLLFCHLWRTHKTV